MELPDSLWRLRDSSEVRLTKPILLLIGHSSADMSFHWLALGAIASVRAIGLLRCVALGSSPEVKTAISLRRPVHSVVQSELRLPACFSVSVASWRTFSNSDQKHPRQRSEEPSLPSAQQSRNGGAFFPVSGEVIDGKISSYAACQGLLRTLVRSSPLLCVRPKVGSCLHHPGEYNETRKVSSGL